ncbi:MAG: virginiamycin lyase [Solirubrobacteraceae bacterium]|nr:virginiamycin lyase [Solirubrobacteraceae bacterium]
MRRTAFVAAAVLLALAPAAGAAVRVDHFEFPYGARGYPVAIAPGTHGKVWSYDSEAGLERVQPRRPAAWFDSGLPHGFSGNIVPAGDGGVWFTTRERLARASHFGAITDYPVGDLRPDALATDADGDPWFSSDGTIGHVDLATGTVESFPAGQPAYIRTMARGADGNLWFGGSGTVGFITPAGEVTRFSVRDEVIDMTAGPGGRIWYTVVRDEVNYEVISIATDGTRRKYKLPRRWHAGAITAGPNRHSVWFVTGVARVARLTPKGALRRYSDRVIKYREPVVTDLAFDTRKHLWLTVNYVDPGNGHARGSGFARMTF